MNEFQLWKFAPSPCHLVLLQAVSDICKIFKRESCSEGRELRGEMGHATCRHISQHLPGQSKGSRGREPPASEQHPCRQSLLASGGVVGRQGPCAVWGSLRILSPEVGKEADCRDPQERIFKFPGMGSFIQHVIY